MALLFGSGVATAQDTYTFTGQQNNRWGEAQNWTGGPINTFPGAGDTAIIPNAKTCTVDSAEFAEVVTVNTDGILVIDTGDTLTIDTNNDGTHDQPLITVNGTLIIQGTLSLDKSVDNAPPPVLTVNGTVKFGKVDTVTPTLLYDRSASADKIVKIDGTGTIVAEGQYGDEGLITFVSGSSVRLVIDSAVTPRTRISAPATLGIRV